MLTNESEYSHSMKAIIILYTFNICIQFIIHIIKFMRYRDSEVSPTIKGLERALDFSFCLGIIAVLNIIAVSTYIFATIMTYFFFALYYLFLIIDEKFPEGRKTLYVAGIPSFFLVLLFFNFWINNEST